MHIINAPIKAQLAVTGACNQRCLYCLSCDSWNTPDLPAKTMHRIIDQLAEAGVFTVDVFGGEPLMRPDLPELLDHLNHRSFRLSLTTNGTLIDAALARRLVRRHKITHFNISLEGTATAHDALRGAGTHARALRGAELLIAAGGSVSLAYTLTAVNAEDIGYVVDAGLGMGASEIRLNELLWTGNAPAHAGLLRPDPQTERRACAQAYRLHRLHGARISGYLLRLHALINRPPGAARPARSRIPLPECGAMRYECLIRPDGWIAPCSGLWHVRIGDLARKSFAEIWRQAPGAAPFRRKRSITLPVEKGCRLCDLQEACFGFRRCVPEYFPGGTKNIALFCRRPAP